MDCPADSTAAPNLPPSSSCPSTRPSAAGLTLPPARRDGPGHHPIGQGGAGGEGELPGGMESQVVVSSPPPTADTALQRDLSLLDAPVDLANRSGDRCGSPPTCASSAERESQQPSQTSRRTEALEEARTVSRLHSWLCAEETVFGPTLTTPGSLAPRPARSSPGRRDPARTQPRRPKRLALAQAGRRPRPDRPLRRAEPSARPRRPRAGRRRPTRVVAPIAVSNAVGTLTEVRRIRRSAPGPARWRRACAPPRGQVDAPRFGVDADLARRRNQGHVWESLVGGADSLSVHAYKVRPAPVEPVGDWLRDRRHFPYKLLAGFVAAVDLAIRSARGHHRLGAVAGRAVPAPASTAISRTGCPDRAVTCPSVRLASVDGISAEGAASVGERGLAVLTETARPQSDETTRPSTAAPSESLVHYNAPDEVDRLPRRSSPRLE